MDTIRATLLTLKDYNGHSLHFVLFLAAVIYLILAEKDKAKRYLLLWLPLTLLAVFLFPLSAWFSMHYLLNQEIYYRELWLIPYAVVVVYAAVHAVSRCKKLWARILILAALIVPLFVTDSGMFSPEVYAPAENPYHLPQEAVDVCDIILSQKGVVEKEYPPLTAFPPSLVEYNRQYTASLFTPYGREALIERWNFDTPFLDTLCESPVPDAEKICTMAADAMIECFVAEKSLGMKGDPADYGYPAAGETEHYIIYMVKWLQ